MKKLLVLLAVFLFIAGCQKDDVIINSDGDQIQKDKVFSLSGSLSGTTTWPMGASAPFRHMEGTGQSTPGGNIQVIMDYLVGSYDPVTMTGTSIMGSGEIITQSGDKMYVINGSGTFSISGTTVTGTATAKIAGGTGEFDNIMGTMTYTASFNQIGGATTATWTGSFTREKPIIAAFTGENQTVSGSCSPGFSRRSAAGTGNASHLGNVSFALEHCVNFTNGLIMDGNDFMEAANGDKVFLTHLGYTLPIPGTNYAAVTMFAEVTGGTGKFENASGYLWLKATQIMPAGACEGGFDGVIKY